MNIFKTSLIFAVVTSSVCAFAANYFSSWRFEKWNAKKTQTNASNGIILYNSKIAEKQGFNGTNGIICDKKTTGHAGGYKYIQDCKEFSWEIKFKLTKGVDGRFGNVLLCYGKNSYGRGQAMFWITPKKQLQYRVNQGDRKLAQYLTSKALDIKPDVWYTARVAVRDGAESKIYLDGVEVASQDKNSVSLSSITAKIPKGYPLFVIGRDLTDLAHVYRPLNGFVDDIVIWKTFEPVAQKTAEK